MPRTEYVSESPIRDTNRRARVSLATLHREIVACARCPRLREHCTEIAATKRAAYRDETYWGKPLPGFGDPEARLLVVGLAPGAHGANRTGRMFTGDRSGLFLMTAMHAAGFASIPRSESRRDGLVLHEAWITAAVRCAPPGNKPTPGEFDACLPFLDAEWRLLPRVAVVVTLGKLAWDATWRVLGGRGQGLKPRPAFAHGARVQAPGDGPIVLGAFHPSQQNTFTGRLTPGMLADVFRGARAAIR
jgi:uracil-DNA glycosylase family 4